MDMEKLKSSPHVPSAHMATAMLSLDYFGSRWSHIPPRPTVHQMFVASKVMPAFFAQINFFSVGEKICVGLSQEEHEGSKCRSTRWELQSFVEFEKCGEELRTLCLVHKCALAGECWSGDNTCPGAEYGSTLATICPCLLSR